MLLGVFSHRNPLEPLKRLIAALDTRLSSGEQTIWADIGHVNQFSIWLSIPVIFNRPKRQVRLSQHCCVGAERAHSVLGRGFE